ncbi:hypothetical protein diail_3557 [Diaporthe ilicicola]|nr:hypothetical protein diail_3557 [Diaporthe ilicicola]
MANDSFNGNNMNVSGSINMTADPPWYKNYGRRVAFAAAVDFDEPSRNLKAYVTPYIKHVTTGKSENEIVLDAIKILQPGGPVLLPPVKLLEDYLATRTEDFSLVNQFIGIHCADPSKARIKLYTATNTSRFDFIQAAMTLGGRLDDESTNQGMEGLAKGINDSSTKPCRSKSTLDRPW